MIAFVWEKTVKWLYDKKAGYQYSCFPIVRGFLFQKRSGLWLSPPHRKSKSPKFHNVMILAQLFRNTPSRTHRKILNKIHELSSNRDLLTQTLLTALFANEPKT